MLPMRPSLLLYVLCAEPKYAGPAAELPLGGRSLLDRPLGVDLPAPTALSCNYRPVRVGFNTSETSSII